MVPFYNPCPLCGSNLDPGEKCECIKREEEISNDKNTKNEKKTHHNAA